MLPTAHGRIDPRLLFDEVARVDDGPRQLSLDELLADPHDHDCCGDDAAGHDHLHDRYEAVTFTSERPMDPRALTRLLEDPPPGLYRVKGFVYFGIPGHTQRYTLQTVGRHIRFETGPWGRGAARVTELVLIGSGIDPDVLLRLDECVRVHETGGAEAMTGVHRYVVEN